MGDHKDIIYGYLSGSAFKGVNASVVRQVQKYECCEEPYPSVTFKLKFARQATTYFRIFIGPCVLLGLLSSMIFLMPYQTGDRTVLGAGILVCLTVMSMWIGFIFPGSMEDAPNILIYYSAIMVMTFISICLGALTTTIRFYKQPPNDLIRRLVIDRISCFMCVFSSNYQYMENVDSAPEAEINYDDQAFTVSKPVGGVGRSLKLDQWRMIGAVVDRMLFVVHFVLTTVITLSLINY